MKIIPLSIVASALVASSVSFAQEQISTSRYTSIDNSVSYAQQNPLEVVVNTKLPQSITTIRDAVEFLLTRSGYSLAEDENHSVPAKILLSHEIPYVHREVVFVSLSEALKMLSGDAYEVVLDPVYRRISFTLKTEYQELYNAENFDLVTSEGIANVQQ